MNLAEIGVCGDQQGGKLGKYRENMFCFSFSRLRKSWGRTSCIRKRASFGGSLRAKYIRIPYTPPCICHQIKVRERIIGSRVFCMYMYISERTRKGKDSCV